MEPPFSCSIYSGDIAVNFFSEIDLSEMFSEFESHKFIPEFFLSREKAQTNSRVIFTHSDSKWELQWGLSDVICCFPLEMLRGGEALLHLGYPLIEAERQKQAGATIHAAACSLNDSGILILGKEGAGKSSTVIRLCQDFGAKLIANDLLVLKRMENEIHLCGGTKFFYLREISVAKSLPHLLSFFSKKENQSDPWRNKIFLQPQELSIKIEAKPITLRKAYLVHIDESQQNLIVKEKHNLADKLYLNENFSRYIRNTCTTFLGKNFEFLGFVPSFDSEDLYKSRVVTINKILTEIGLIYISGSSKEIAEYIKNHHV